METPELNNAEFWHGEDNHIAINPHRPRDAYGLRDFAGDSLHARGWCFFQTSGSEGTPKWVGLAKESFLISARAVNAHFSITSQDRWLVALPAHHVGGFAIHARGFVSASKVVSITGRWDAAEFAAQCSAQSITLTSLVPTQLFDLASLNLPPPPSLRALIIGGGALAPDLRERALTLGWPVFESYGMTEAASQIATQSVDAMEVLPLWQVTTDDNNILTIRGEALAKGYASRDAHGVWAWQPIDPAAGLITRDRVHLWQHGGRSYIKFLGRDSSFVKILGELVNVDALQQRLPAGAAVVPLPDARREARLVLAVEKSADAATGLLDAFNDGAAPFEKADAVIEIDALPRTSIGKVDMERLKTLLRQR